jgi:hypothetical protein
MSVFRRHRDSARTVERPTDHTVAGLDAWAAAQGWQPAPARPFDGHLEGTVEEVTLAMYGLPRGSVAHQTATIGETHFGDAYRGEVDGRVVTVANAFTYTQSVQTKLNGYTATVSVIAVELPMVLPVVVVQPRSMPMLVKHADVATGDPAFDDCFVVGGLAIGGVEKTIFSDEVRARIMARDDWCFVPNEYLFGCVTKGACKSVDDVRARVDAVVGIVDAIPESVMPKRVDRSFDDLLARIAKIDTVDDALALLQSLTPDERDRLAKSDTPLAAFADVRTPDEAMARLQSLPPNQVMQVMAMFERVDDQGGSR